MKRKIQILVSVAAVFFIALQLKAQKIPTDGYISVQAQPVAEKYQYETVPGDPLNARIYTLPNGLKVYMTVYKNTPRIHAYVAVRAGSKNDPADATGLAHYFEHMMFKGTPNFGTINFAEEVIYINKIDSLFEVYRLTVDEKERKAIYQMIDSISYIASGFAIPNEYDKLMSIIGSTGTNAYTSLEQTVYIENFPSNQLENWCMIQADRFAHPVLRLFHTELETIYEEKNMTMTNDNMKSYFALLEGLFPNHPYGTQTVIGTQEHLKNPSMKKIREFHSMYYVPNNMAICLSGDFDPDEAIRYIDKYFGKLPAGNVPEFKFDPAPPMNSPVTMEVLGPDAETVYIGFRFDGAGSKDALILKIIDMILMNSAAGLFDLNLVQKQQVLEAYSYNSIMADYTALIMAGKPKSGQTLEEVKDLLLSQLELIKKGDFEEWMIQAIINDMKLQQIKGYEDNENRAGAFVDAFVLGIPWADYVHEINLLEKITKEDVMKFAQERFSQNYVLVYKRTGKDPSVKKIPKNKVTPVKINRDAESDFQKTVRDNKVPDIQPHFLDFDRDINKFNVGSIPVQYIENLENETFKLYYVFDMGTQHNKKLEPAIEYLEFIGTSKYSPEDIKKEFYKIGCTYGVYTSSDQVYVTLSGLSENMEAGMNLFEHLLTECTVDQEAWNNYLSNTMQKRIDAKKNIQYIFSYLIMYGMYGEANPGTWQLTEKELNTIDPQEMIQILKELTSYQHKVLFYGSKSSDELTTLLQKYHKVPSELKSYPPKHEFVQQPTDKNTVLFVNFDTPHTQILMVSRGDKGYDKQRAAINRLFNDYFGMNMNSIVFQEMRESRGLAYTAISFYQEPGEADHFYTGISYIATQFDKVEEAINGFYDLLNNMPLSQKAFDIAKESVIQTLRTERTTREDIFFTYQQAQKLGLNEDINELVLKMIQNFTMDDVKNFQEAYLKDKTHTILVLGNEEDLSMKVLKKFGKVQKLTMEDIFGY
jgi:predicted Zn-dependent peptidase